MNNEFQIYNYEIKKSKFITYIIKPNTKAEFNNFIEHLWKEHKKARHICYAYKFFDNDSKMIAVKAYDDGEPKGTAGYPILNLIEKNQLDDIAIIVVRYFGGQKLGAGPLLRTYVKAANECLKLNDLVNTRN